MVHKEFVQYLRRKDGRPKGVVVVWVSHEDLDEQGFIPEGSEPRFHTGWSMCHPKDTFSKEWALKIARGRASKAKGLGSLTTSSFSTLFLPEDIFPTWCTVMERAGKYMRRHDPATYE